MTIPAFAHSTQEAEISESLVGLVVTSRTARTAWLVFKKKERIKEEKKNHTYCWSPFTPTPGVTSLDLLGGHRFSSICVRFPILNCAWKSEDNL